MLLASQSEMLATLEAQNQPPKDLRQQAKSHRRLAKPGTTLQAML
jgi:hypothetical protein